MAVMAERRWFLVHLCVAEKPLRCVGDKKLASRWHGFRFSDFDASRLSVQQGTLPLGFGQDVGWNDPHAPASPNSILTPLDEVFAFGVSPSCSTDQHMIPMNASIGARYDRRKAPTLGVLDVLDDVDSLRVRLAGHTVTSGAYVDS